MYKSNWFSRAAVIAALASLMMVPLTSIAQTPLDTDAWMTRVDINVSQPWTDSGRDVVAGDSVEILAYGFASGAAGSSQTEWSGPEGTWAGHAPSYPCPNAPFNAVIGRIGDNGTPFYVGRALSMRVESSGRLFLGFNDDIMEGNDGKYIALITADVRSLPLVSGLVIHPTGDQVSLYWNSVDIPQIFYRVYRDSVQTGGYTEFLGSTADTTFVDNDSASLPAGKRFYLVRASR